MLGGCPASRSDASYNGVRSFQTRVVAMAVNFVTVDRETPDWFPASVQEHLPEDHLARFVVKIVDQLDLSPLVSAYAGSGSRPYPPAMLVALLFYGYGCPRSSARSKRCWPTPAITAKRTSIAARPPGLTPISPRPASATTTRRWPSASPTIHRTPQGSRRRPTPMPIG